MQLQRLVPALAGHDVAFATVDPAYREDVPSARFYAVNDATRWNRFGLVVLAFRVLGVLLRERPDVVISTGAAPGFFGVVLGKLLGAGTIWLDSMANVERLSLSGRTVRLFADLWLTQWPHLAAARGPRYEGALV